MVIGNFGPIGLRCAYLRIEIFEGENSFSKGDLPEFGRQSSFFWFENMDNKIRA